MLAAGTTALEPAPPRSRKYTLTHNDLTGSLRLTIGPDFNHQQISGFYTRLLRDEVVAEWVNIGSSGYALHVYCHVSGEERWLAPPLLRNYIFRREMPLVLDTLVYADRQLLRAQPELAQAQVYVHFQSSVRELDTVEYWGVLGDRSSWPRGPTSILLRVIYAVVGWPPALEPQPADLSIDSPAEPQDVETAVRAQLQLRELQQLQQHERERERELQRQALLLQPEAQEQARLQPGQQQLPQQLELGMVEQRRQLQEGDGLQQAQQLLQLLPPGEQDQAQAHGRLGGRSEQERGQQQLQPHELEAQQSEQGRWEQQRRRRGRDAGVRAAVPEPAVTRVQGQDAAQAEQATALRDSTEALVPVEVAAKELPTAAGSVQQVLQLGTLLPDAMAEDVGSRAVLVGIAAEAGLATGNSESSSRLYSNGSTDGANGFVRLSAPVPSSALTDGDASRNGSSVGANGVALGRPGSNGVGKGDSSGATDCSFTSANGTSSGLRPQGVPDVVSQPALTAFGFDPACTPVSTDTRGRVFVPSSPPAVPPRDAAAGAAAVAASRVRTLPHREGLDACTGDADCACPCSRAEADAGSAADAGGLGQNGGGPGAQRTANGVANGYAARSAAHVDRGPELVGARAAGRL